MIYSTDVDREKLVLDNEEVNAQIRNRYVSKISMKKLSA